MFFLEILDFEFLWGFFLNIHKVNNKVNMENEARFAKIIKLINL